jgi:hemolysin activation/secretion protein
MRICLIAAALCSAQIVSGDEEKSEEFQTALQEKPVELVVEEDLDQQFVEEEATREFAEESSEQQFVQEEPSQQVAEEQFQQEPVQEIAEEQSIQEAIQEAPVEQVVEEQLQEDLIQQVAEEQTVQEEPTQQVAEEQTVQQPVQEEPAQKAAEEEPAEQPIQDEPVQKAAEEQPTQQPVQGEPAHEPAEEHPLGQAVPEGAVEPVVQEEPAQQPVEEKPEQKVAQRNSQLDQKVIMKNFRGLVLLRSSKQASTSDIEEVEGVVLKDVDLPGDPGNLYLDLKEYWGQELRGCDIFEISHVVAEYYRKNHRPLVVVKVPPQVVKTGVIQLVVYETRLGSIRSKCNEHFSNERLENYIRTAPGCRINVDSLATDLEWINRNPFRTTDLIFTPSQKPGYTDIELVTADRSPWRVYAGADNTGIAQSGHNRYYAGLNWGNAFGLDHILTYQFTSGTHYDEFWAQSLDYTALLPWHHTIDLYGGYSEVTAVLQSLSHSKTRGNSAQASLRYEIPLPSRVSFIDEFTFGFDWKRTNTNLSQLDVLVFGKTANLTQLMVGFNSGYETEMTKTSATIELYGSPGQWLPDQQNSHYNDLRRGAKNTYIYGRLSVASIIQIYKYFTFEPSLRCQGSSANLLASEQFGVGGYSTVRGYEEREVNGDNAVIVNLELRSMPLRLMGSSCKCGKKQYRDDLRFLVFFDYGFASNHKLYFGEPSSETLMGIGPGVRYAIQKYLTARLDYGFQLKQLSEFPNTTHHKLHFGLVVSY